VRAFHDFIAARQAREAIERLLDRQGWPAVSPLSRAVDHCLEIEEAALEAMQRASAARAALWRDCLARGERWSA